MTIYTTRKMSASPAAGFLPISTDQQVLERLKSINVTQHMPQNVLREKVIAKRLLRKVFGTQNTYTFGVGGSGFSGLDCILSMVLPGDKVVAFVNGKFSGLGSLTIRSKASKLSTFAINSMNKPLENVVIVNVPHGELISGDVVAEILAEHQPMWSVMPYCETTGQHINDIKGFNDACAEYDAMGIIDAVYSRNIHNFDIDEYPGVVAWASSPQKNVSNLLTTVSPVSFRHEAIELVKQRGCYPYVHHPILEARHWGIIEGSDVDACAA